MQTLKKIQSRKDKYHHKTSFELSSIVMKHFDSDFIKSSDKTSFQPSLAVIKHFVGKSER